MLKRAFDIIVSAVTLVVLSPVFLACAIAIKLDSPGPVIFLQERVGRSGRLFRIAKFRTMFHRNTSDGPLITPTGDPRVTRCGRWLRKSKLDELPQLANVLLGQMSLVGPRPEAPRYVSLWPVTQRELILSVRPGITDQASILFRDEGSVLASAVDPESCYIEEILPRKLDLYVEYVMTHSCLGDIRILWSTACALLAGHRHADVR